MASIIQTPLSPTEVNFQEITTWEYVGLGSPEGVVAARIGATYRDQTAGATFTLWVKKNNANQPTGWVGVG